MSSQPRVFRGARIYFLVPFGIAAVLIGLAVLSFVAFLIEPTYTRGFGRRISPMLWISMACVGAAAVVFSVGNKSYIDKVTLDESGISVKKAIGEPAIYKWDSIKKIYSDQTAVYIEFRSRQTVGINACLENFEEFRQTLDSEFRARGTLS